MQHHIFCQSCGMPIDDSALHGNEMDNSVNPDYCHHCYKDGAFVNPRLTLNKMKFRVIKRMDRMNVPQDIIESVVERLPTLKRWKKL
jgi:uncharacterized protein CbrC (UPF0167 family)